MVLTLLSSISSTTSIDNWIEPLAIIDNYESIIWTDRYWESGDFELVIYASEYLISNLKTDMLLVSDESETVMVVEKIEIETDIEKGNKLTVSGRSLSSILDRRIVWDKTNFGSFDDSGNVLTSENLLTAIDFIINNNVINPASSLRKIPHFIFDKSKYQNTTIAQNTFAGQYVGISIYEFFTNICKEFQIGFKIILNDDYDMELVLFEGVDRSYNQDDNDYVIFSPSFDNLITSKYYESITLYKNVAKIGGATVDGVQDFATVYTTLANDPDTAPSGFARRETYVDAYNVSKEDNESTESYQGKLRTRGLKELSEVRVEQAVDGAMDVYGSFCYERDFFIGDIVQVETEYGHQVTVRVTEMIISDGQEDSNQGYPTFEKVSENIKKGEE